MLFRSWEKDEKVKAKEAATATKEKAAKKKSKKKSTKKTGDDLL